MKALSGGEAEVDIPLINLVTLSRAGVAVKMSKRAGTIVTLREVVDEGGAENDRLDTEAAGERRDHQRGGQDADRRHGGIEADDVVGIAALGQDQRQQGKHQAKRKAENGDRGDGGNEVAPGGRGNARFRGQCPIHGRASAVAVDGTSISGPAGQICEGNERIANSE